MKITLSEIRRRNQVRKQKRIQAQLRAQTARIELTYTPDHIFAGVTFHDPVENGPVYTGPSYVSIAFTDLIKSPNWKHARKTFAGLLFNGHTLESARIETMKVYGV